MIGFSRLVPESEGGIPDRYRGDGDNAALAATLESLLLERRTVATFRIEIATDNAAFEGDCVPEIQRILAEVSARLDNTDRGTCRDVNGNNVGKFGFTVDNPKNDEAAAMADSEAAAVIGK